MFAVDYGGGICSCYGICNDYERRNGLYTGPGIYTGDYCISMAVFDTGDVFCRTGARAGKVDFFIESNELRNCCIQRYFILWENAGAGNDFVCSAAWNSDAGRWMVCILAFTEAFC